MGISIENASGSVPESVVEQLLKTSPGLEVWWDSSPLVYQNWVDQLMNQCPTEKQATLHAQLVRLYDPDHPENTLFRGVTTNPPLSLNAMKNDPERWEGWIRDYCQKNRGASVEDVFWALYKEIVLLGAKSYLPVFKSSGFVYGYLSGQVDPRKFFDGELMLRQALELSALAPNVMVKIPGTTEGVDVIRELTARGIPTNCTAGYIIPQFLAVAKAVQEGLIEARKKGVDLTHWRSVVTYMSARWENSEAFTEEAMAAGVEITPNDRRWAGLALFKKAYRIYRENAYPSKMLICSVRMGPNFDGAVHCSHLEETAGADAVFTLPPNFLSELFIQGENLQFKPRIWEDIPSDVMERLMKIPYFTRSYEPDGYSQAEFNTIPSLVSTYKEFSGATQKMVDFVQERMPKF